MVAFGEYECDGTAPTLKMRDYKDATDLVAQPVANVLGAKKDGGWRGDLDNDTYVAHSLRGEGFDASEDGTGRGTPIVPVALRGHSDYGDGLPSLRAKGGDCGGGSEALIAAYRTSGNFGAWDTGDRVDALMTGTDPNSHVVAFAQNTRDEVRIFGEDGSTVGALSAEPGMKQQCYVAQAFDLRGRDGGAHFEGPHDTANIRAASGGSSRSYVAQQWAVRRLTPRECERLQGFPDDWTLTPDAKGKSQADGPRYKQLGNSWAVPVVRWIGERLASESRA
jgi:DNA (cytosine-5)-methyltransferase 1